MSSAEQMKVSWVSTEELARQTGLSARFFRYQIKIGCLKAIKFGTRGGRGTYRILTSDADVYIKQMLASLSDAA